MAVDCCVQELVDKTFYYPPTIPKPRKKHLSLHDYAIFCVYFAVGYYYSESFLSFISLLSLLLTTIFLSEIFHRIKQIFLEREHLASRYDGSAIKLLNDVKFTTKNFVLLSTTFATTYYFKNQISISSCNIVCIFFAFMTALDLSRKLALDHSALNDSMLLEKLNGMDCGSGMAYSYFYGYLKLVLPDYGGNGQSFEDLICTYEANHKVHFPVKKLFVLMPLSAKCLQTLNDPDLGIEESSSLPEKTITVAGVKDRVYKNAVYKIIPEGRIGKVYVCIEFATPLKTFHDFLTSSSSLSGSNRRHKKEIVSMFYRTLKMILQEDSECNKLCELIFYDDMLPNGEYRQNIADIVLNRINEIQS